MKKDKLMQEFENMKIDNANFVYGGSSDHWEESVCSRETQYTTSGTQQTTDKKTDTVVDDRELIIDPDATGVVLPIIFP